MTYSRDFCNKVLAVRAQENLSMAKVAKRFGVALTSVMRWSNNIESIKKRNKPATKIDMEALKLDVEKYPDAYQYERAERLSVSEGCVFHALKRLNVTYKKKHFSIPRQAQKNVLLFANSLSSIRQKVAPWFLLMRAGLLMTCLVLMDTQLKEVAVLAQGH